MLNYSVEDLLNVIRKSQSGNSYVGENPDKKGQTDRDMTKDILALLKTKGSVTMHDIRRIQEEYDHIDITPGMKDQAFVDKLNQAYKRDNQNGNQNPNTPEGMSEKPGNDTQTGKPVANTNAGVAGATPGDWIMRSNGQKYELNAGDIKWAKDKLNSTQSTSQHNSEREKDQGDYNGGDESPDTSNMDSNVMVAGTGLTKNGAKPMTTGIGKAMRYFADGQEVDKETYEKALKEWEAAHPSKWFPDRSQEREDLYKYGAR